ncbi:hypothetical protein M5D96_012038, partial [Drosophila gunungcola]
MSSHCNRRFRFCPETQISTRCNCNLNTTFIRTYCILILSAK